MWSMSTGNSLDLGTGQTNASLGSFAIAPLAPGVSTTYNQTPFQISLHCCRPVRRGH